MKTSWPKKSQASPNSVVCLCGCRCCNRPLEVLTLALFTLAEAFKHTMYRQYQQLQLSLHVGGELLTENFWLITRWGSGRGFYILSTHGFTEIRGKAKQRKRESNRGHLKENISRLKLQVMERLEEKSKANERKEKWECSRRGRRREKSNEKEEGKRLKV